MPTARWRWPSTAGRRGSCCASSATTSCASGRARPDAMLGTPRLHLRSVGSTSDRARALAQAGAPQGGGVRARVQAAGRGRRGGGWRTQRGAAAVVSVILREPPPLLPLIAAVAVAEACGAAAAATIKWPNDVLVD